MHNQITMHLPFHLKIQQPVTTSDESSSSFSSPSHYSSLNIGDHIQFMQEQESQYRARDHLSSPSATITSDDRRVLCSWSYCIVESCSIDKSVACIAMSYLDRFMSTSSHRAMTALLSRQEYQLALVSCLVIALKCREGIRVGTDFVADTICLGLYEKDEIDAMEMEVLQALKWKLNGPSSHEFINAIVELLPGSIDATSSLIALAYDHIEAAILDYEMALQPSSSLAYAALLTCLQMPLILDKFHPMDIIDWISMINSVLGGMKDQVFVKRLANIVCAKWHLSRVFDDEASFVNDGTQLTIIDDVQSIDNNSLMLEDEELFPIRARRVTMNHE